MACTYPNLFTPIGLRHKTLKNRIVFGAHTSNMSHEGLPGDRHFGYYRERASGDRVDLKGCDQIEMETGDVFVIETPGGGGYGALGGE